MLVARIADQLGNQMFAYASVKTIAQHRQEPFGFVREWNDPVSMTVTGNTGMKSIRFFRPSMTNF